MICSNCGKKLKGDENFCRICGTPVVREEQEEKEEIVELTGNIDVSKINLSSTGTITTDDTMDVEMPDVEKNKELSAMIEISKSDEESNKKTKKETKKKKGRFEIKDPDSSNKIKEILAEMNPQTTEEEKKDEADEVIDEMKEPTSIIPDELISDYKKKETKKNSTKKKKDKKEKEESEEKEELKVEEEPKTEEVKEEIKEEVKEEKTDNKVEEEKEEIKQKEVEEKEPEEKIISLIDDKTEKIELSKDKTQAYDEPIITSDEDSDDKELELDNESSSKAIVFIILFIAALACAGYLLFMYVGTNDKLNKYKDKYDKLSNSQTEVEEKKEENNTTSEISKIEYNGYEITFKEGDKFVVNDNKVIISRDKNTLALSIKKDTKYSTIKYSKEEYKSAIEKDDYEVQSYGTKVVDESEYVVFELKDKDGNLYLVAYTKLTEDDTIGFVLSTVDNKIDYDLLSVTNELIKNTKENKNSNSKNVKLFTKQD